jgi:hypothetical protein
MEDKAGKGERRQVPRVQPEGIIKVNLLAPGKLETGLVVDLNNAGAFVATDMVLETGESLSIELDIPGVETPTPLQAIVARRSEEIRGRTRTIPAGLGVVFVGNTPEERQLIQKVVMSTLTLDLLSFGCEAQVSTSDTMPFLER